MILSVQLSYDGWNAVERYPRPSPSCGMVRPRRGASQQFAKLPQYHMMNHDLGWILILVGDIQMVAKHDHELRREANNSLLPIIWMKSQDFLGVSGSVCLIIPRRPPPSSKAI
jgi:hypothetical protein